MSPSVDYVIAPIFLSVIYDGTNAYNLSDQKAPEKFAGKKVTVTSASTRTPFRWNLSPRQSESRLLQVPSFVSEE